MRIPNRFTEELQEEIVATYRAGNKIKDIAQEYGTKHEAVSEILKQHGFTIARYRNKFSLDTERKIAARYAQGEMPSTLAKEYGCAQFTVRDIARRHGVPISPRGNRYREFSDEEVADMARLWKQGLSQTVIGQRLGISQSVVSRVLRATGYAPQQLRPVGERHGLWKGGRTVTEHGYVLILVQPDNPYASMRNRMGYVPEHRLKMAKALGRPLERHETVHHKNADRQDNRLENLQLRQGRHGNGVVMRCKDCGSHNIEVTHLADE